MREDYMTAIVHPPSVRKIISEVDCTDQIFSFMLNAFSMKVKQSLQSLFSNNDHVLVLMWFPNWIMLSYLPSNFISSTFSQLVPCFHALCEKPVEKVGLFEVTAFHSNLIAGALAPVNPCVFLY